MVRKWRPSSGQVIAKSWPGDHQVVTNPIGHQLTMRQGRVIGGETLKLKWPTQSPTASKTDPNKPQPEKMKKKVFCASFILIRLSANKIRNSLFPLVGSLSRTREPAVAPGSSTLWRNSSSWVLDSSPWTPETIAWDCWEDFCLGRDWCICFPVDAAAKMYLR